MDSTIDDDAVKTGWARAIELLMISYYMLIDEWGKDHILILEIKQYLMEYFENYGEDAPRDFRRE